MSDNEPAEKQLLLLRELVDAIGVLTNIAHDVVNTTRACYVDSGVTCFWYDSVANTWVDVVFHKWCSSVMPPAAIVHSIETGKCFLAKIDDLRFDLCADDS